MPIARTVTQNPPREASAEYVAELAKVAPDAPAADPHAGYEAVILDLVRRVEALEAKVG